MAELFNGKLFAWYRDDRHLVPVLSDPAIFNYFREKMEYVLGRVPVQLSYELVPDDVTPAPYPKPWWWIGFWPGGEVQPLGIVFRSRDKEQRSGLVQFMNMDRDLLVTALTEYFRQ